MNDTPETHEAVERWRQGKINIFDEMARLERERDTAQALVAEMKQAIVWAKAEAKERLHRLDQAACERRTWLEAHEKMKRERDEARAERDEWIARFRADEELINEAMLK